MSRKIMRLTVYWDYEAEEAEAVTEDFGAVRSVEGKLMANHKTNEYLEALTEIVRKERGYGD